MMDDLQRNLFILIFSSSIIFTNCYFQNPSGNVLFEQKQDESKEIFDLLSDKVFKLTLAGLLEDFIHKSFLLASKKLLFDTYMLRSAMEKVKYGEISYPDLEKIRIYVIRILKQNDNVKQHKMLNQHMIEKYDSIAQYLTDVLKQVEEVVTNIKNKNDISKNHLDLTMYLLKLFDDIKHGKIIVSNGMIQHYILTNVRKQHKDLNQKRFKRNLHYFNSKFMVPNPAKYAFAETPEPESRKSKLVGRTKMDLFSYDSEVEPTPTANVRADPNIRRRTVRIDQGQDSTKRLMLCTNSYHVRTVSNSDNVLIPVALNKLFNQYFINNDRNSTGRIHLVENDPNDLKCKVFLGQV